MNYVVVNKYTGRVLYKGPSKEDAKKAYKTDTTGTWVYFNGQSCDLRTFMPKKGN